jgi:DNA helicase HerA-like ATPase
MPIRLAPGLDLPDEAVTQTFAILAKRGVGKTNTATVMVEEMVRRHLPVVAIDPIGVWWGLRYAKDGKGPGLPVVIFGGEHADVPLEESMGEESTSGSSRTARSGASWRRSPSACT